MFGELWIVDPTRMVGESFVKNFETVTRLTTESLSIAELKKRIITIRISLETGDAPILILLDSQLPATVREQVVTWRKGLLWPYQKYLTSPLIGVFSTSTPFPDQDWRTWSAMPEIPQDDCHFCPFERLPAEIPTLSNRAKARRLYAEYGMVMSPDSPLVDLKTRINVLAKRDTTVLITGEPGTGKELIAKALYVSGPRSRGPFIPVNCAAIPDSLFESELFGTKRGAATGATDRPGYIEQADKGTLFLDEIGDISLAGQAKLLRVLQEREVRRLGAITSKPIDIRLIVATNKDLKKGIQAGWYREDFFSRISVATITLPPLRQRGETDILTLIDYFLLNDAQKYGQTKKDIAPQAVQALLHHPWKQGNIRELFSALESAIVACETRRSRTIELTDLSDLDWESTNSADNLDESPRERSLSHFSDDLRQQFNPQHALELTCDHREQIKAAIDLCQGKLSKAARLLQQAGYVTGASRGRLRNLLGLSQTKEAGCPELRTWFLGKYAES